MAHKHSAPHTPEATHEPYSGFDRETPLMAQYNQIKAAQPDALLLFRVGDFYETFGSDAVVVAGVLGIVLTKRNNGGSDVELAGFPYHSLELYLPRLVRAGHRVAICDQLEKPSKEKKIVRRGITEVVTPGVATGDNLLDTKANNFLACVHPAAKGLFGAAFLDVSTGEFLVAEGDGPYLDKLFQSFQPSEILYPKGRKRDLEKILGDKAYLYGLDEWIFTEDYARGKLLEQFEVANLKGFGVEDLALAQIAAGAALHYLGSIEINNRRHFTHLSRILPDRYVWLDRFTVRNLELIHTPHENGRTLLSVLDQTITPMGSRLLKKWVALPLKDRKAIEGRHDTVRHLIDKGDDASAIEQQLRQVGDLERLVSKAPLGKINPREMRQLLRSLLAIEALRGQLAASESPALQGMGDRLNPCPTLRERIQRELQEDPPALVGKGNVIAAGVSDELDELRGLIHNSKEILLDIQRREAQNTGISNLKIGFNSVFGYYLEVTNKHKDNEAIPREWIRKQTLANAERYVTEELKVLEQKILGAEDNILAIEERLFADLAHAVQEFIRPIQLNASVCAQLDCLLSFSKVAVRNNYCRPQLNDGLSIEIAEGRHPVIELQLPIGEPYVPNDIFLSNDEQQILVLTGPNMAGKSALLRQTALICLMAQMGELRARPHGPARAVGQSLHPRRGQRQHGGGRVHFHGGNDRNRQYPQQHLGPKPDPVGRDRARHQHLRRDFHRLEHRRVPARKRNGPPQDAFCDPLPRTQRTGREIRADPKLPRSHQRGRQQSDLFAQAAARRHPTQFRHSRGAHGRDAQTGRTALRGDPRTTRKKAHRRPGRPSSRSVAKCSGAAGTTFDFRRAGGRSSLGKHPRSHPRRRCQPDDTRGVHDETVGMEKNGGRSLISSESPTRPKLFPLCFQQN